MESTAFYRVPFLHTAWNTLHSNTLPGIHCIQSRSIGPRCMEFTAINQNPLHHTARSPLHSIGLVMERLRSRGEGVQVPYHHGSPASLWASPPICVRTWFHLNFFHSQDPCQCRLPE